MGNTTSAEECFLDAIRIEPTCSSAYHYLANLYEENGQLDLALKIYRKGDALSVLRTESLYNFAHTLCRVGSFESSIPIYKKALQQQPHFDRAWNGLGLAHRKLGRYEESERCFHKAAEANTASAMPYFYLGQTCQTQGKVIASKNHFAATLRHDPDLTAARWQYHLALPVLYNEKREIPLYREQFSKGLDTLLLDTPLETGRQQQAALTAACHHTNFYLSYQGRDDRNLLCKYGCLLSRIMNACFPEASINRQITRVPGKPIKVGFVSAHLTSHTVSFLFEGWIRTLDRRTFNIACYHLDQMRDPVSQRIKNQVGLFREFDGDFEKLVREILSDQPDVLIYLDIGMNAVATCFAALKLAPLQCVTWGHPVTTGLPSVDYFLSSQLMEPENGQAHYSEKLVPLPNLSVYVEAPSLPVKSKTREQFGLDGDTFLLLSSQSLFKYLPQYDYLFAEIAVVLPKARFVFISHPSQHVTDTFQQRMIKAFQMHELDFMQAGVIMPRLDRDDFLSLNIACDVVLDPPGWSGGKTALESFACGKPVVTLPGPFMRGRHTYAMLKRMAIEETIADDETQYIKIVERLGSDSDFYHAVQKKVMAHRHLLFEDKTAVKGLEAFLAAAIKQKEA